MGNPALRSGRIEVGVTNCHAEPKAKNLFAALLRSFALFRMPNQNEVTILLKEYTIAPPVPPYVATVLALLW